MILRVRFSTTQPLRWSCSGGSTCWRAGAHSSRDDHVGAALPERAGQEPRRVPRSELVTGAHDPWLAYFD
jgi:hypothetical protein